MSEEGEPGPQVNRAATRRTSLNWEEIWDQTKVEMSVTASVLFRPATTHEKSASSVSNYTS